MHSAFLCFSLKYSLAGFLNCVLRLLGLHALGTFLCSFSFWFVFPVWVYRIFPRTWDCSDGVEARLAGSFSVR